MNTKWMNGGEGHELRALTETLPHTLSHTNLTSYEHGADGEDLL